MSKNRPLIGAHVSTAGGFDKAIDRAEEIGANCAQIFTKSNRQWRAKKITESDAATFVQRQQSSNVKVVVAHAAYLINLGSKNDETVAKSVDALATELARCELLAIPYLILHPGTARFDDDEEKSMQFIAQHVDQALEQSNTKHVTLLLEVMAGQGSMSGRTFEQLGAIIQHSTHKKRIGVCFDTCHAFAAGYEFGTTESYKKLWSDFDETIGIHKLKAFHMNDSQKPCGSRVDRHDHIGKGQIPLQAFQMIMQDKRFTDIPKLLETPKGDDQLKSDIENIETLQNLL